MADCMIPHQYTEVKTQAWNGCDQYYATEKVLVNDMLSKQAFYQIHAIKTKLLSNPKTYFMVGTNKKVNSKQQKQPTSLSWSFILCSTVNNNNHNDNIFCLTSG